MLTKRGRLTNPELLVHVLLFFTFRASGTVYTAIDVATGQEVRLLQLVSKTNISGRVEGTPVILNVLLSMNVSVCSWDYWDFSPYFFFLTLNCDY